MKLHLAASILAAPAVFVSSAYATAGSSVARSGQVSTAIARLFKFTKEEELAQRIMRWQVMITIALYCFID